MRPSVIISILHPSFQGPPCNHANCQRPTHCKGNRLEIVDNGSEGHTSYRLIIPHHKNAKRWGGKPIECPIPKDMMDVMEPYISWGHRELTKFTTPKPPFLFLHVLDPCEDEEVIVHPLTMAQASTTFHGIMFKEDHPQMSLGLQRLRSIFVQSMGEAKNVSSMPHHGGAAHVLGHCVDQWRKSYDREWCERHVNEAIDKMPSWRAHILSCGDDGGAKDSGSTSDSEGGGDEEGVSDEGGEGCRLGEGDESEDWGASSSNEGESSSDMGVGLPCPSMGGEWEGGLSSKRRASTLGVREEESHVAKLRKEHDALLKSGDGSTKVEEDANKRLQSLVAMREGLKKDIARLEEEQKAQVSMHGVRMKSIALHEQKLNGEIKSLQAKRAAIMKQVQGERAHHERVEGEAQRHVTNLVIQRKKVHDNIYHKRAT